MKKTLKRVAAILLAAALAGALFIGGMVLIQNAANAPEKADAIIVLGCALRGDIPSPMLERRLSRALELFGEGYAPCIIVCGGQGTDETITEAQGMENYLLAAGVDKGAIIQETTSQDTWENLGNAKAIMAEKGMETALIVTSEFHLPRALSYARELGMTASGASCYTWWHLRIYYTLRECAGWVKHWLLN